MNFKPSLIDSTCATRVYVNDFRKFSVEQKWSKRKRETFWKTRSRQHTKACVNKAGTCVLQWAVWRSRAWFFKCRCRFAWPFWACCRRKGLVIVSLTPPVTATLFPHSYGQYQGTLELIHLQRFISPRGILVCYSLYPTWSLFSNHSVISLSRETDFAEHCRCYNQNRFDRLHL